MELALVVIAILVVARLVGELAVRAGQPAILGELMAGVGLGFLINSFPGYFPYLAGLPDNELFKALVELGIFFLMFMAGMEIRLKELVKASKPAAVVALGGIMLPFGLGYFLGQMLIPDSEYKFLHSFFLGVTLSITAIPVSVRVLIDLKQLNTRLGHTILGAAVIDDVVGLGLLATLTSMLELGRMPSGSEMVLLVAKVLGFVLFAIVAGRFVIPAIGRKLHRLKGKELEFTIALVIAVVFGAVAEFLGMHAMIGAFAAGLSIQRGAFRDQVVEDIEETTSALTLGFLAPILFASIGLHINLLALNTALLFTVAYIAVAVLGKVVGAGVPARAVGFSKRDSLAIGVGMNGRGAVELVVAAVALEAGLFSYPLPTPPIVAAIFSATVLMAIVTTAMTPIGLRLLLGPGSRRSPTHAAQTATIAGNPDEE